jgi:hypothetical protein
MTIDDGLADAEPFFIRQGDLLVPTESALGPWAAGALHGRVVIGLLGAEIERQHGDPAYMPARLTVDLYRAPSMAPIQMETRRIRDGHRIRVVDAELISEGKSAGRASCQFLRRGANPAGAIWTGCEWDAPRPEDTPDADPRAAKIQARWWRSRPITGSMAKAGPRKGWIAEVRRLVGGEPLTPFARVAAGVDYASPMAHAGEGGLAFINSDLTLYLHRLPVGEWIGYETVSQGATDGVAVGHCNVYDVEGRIGWASACALGQAKVPTGEIPKAR